MRIWFCLFVLFSVNSYATNLGNALSNGMANLPAYYKGVDAAKRQQNINTMQQGIKNDTESVANWWKATSQIFQDRKKCADNLEIVPELQAVKDKVLLSSKTDQTPFSMLANDNMPTTEEKAILMLWGQKMDECHQTFRSTISSQSVPAKANDFYGRLLNLANSAYTSWQGLLLDLVRSESKMTYGQFSLKRKELSENTQEALGKEIAGFKQSFSNSVKDDETKLNQAKVTDEQIKAKDAAEATNKKPTIPATPTHHFTDFTCLSACTNRGYQWGLCEKQCSY